MHNLNLTDETFDINQSNNYILLMQSGLNGFTYAICDTVRNKCILLKHFASQCSSWEEFRNFQELILDSENILQSSFKGIHHIVNYPQFTAVPEDFIPDKLLDYELFFPGLSNSDTTITASNNSQLKTAILCPYPNRLIGLLQKRFNCVKLSHNALPFALNLVNESNKTLRYLVHMIVQEGSVIIGVAQSGKLAFLNIFKTETFEDLLYYMLSVLEKFKIIPLQAELYLINETENKSIPAKIEAHVSKVRMIKASQSLVYSYIFTDEVLEHFANMLNLYNCE
jgi:hypothetical protein